MVRRVRIGAARNSQKFSEMEMAKNGNAWEWLGMAGNGWQLSVKLSEVVENGQKWSVML